MANSDAGKLIEVISTFTFRNKGSILIPKSKREKAYIQAVDVFVESISYSSYRSEKTEPDESFYGYATLVFQDSLSDKIPLRFGRNRIYQERNEQALSQWEFHRQFYSTKDYVDSFFRLLTEPDAPIPPYNPPNPLFVELPLRELYIECTPNTQFKIEYTQWEPEAYTNDNSISFDGKSQQQDGDKDGGLPSNGTQPRQNPSGNPYKDNSSPSNPSDLGEFFNDKFGLSGENSSLNDSGESGYSPSPTYYVVTEYTTGYPLGCGDPILYEQFQKVGAIYTEPPTYSYEITGTYPSCNGETGGSWNIIINGSVAMASGGLLGSVSLGLHVTDRQDGDPDFFYSSRPVS